MDNGKVYFVGAGPGDPQLITVKGRSLLENADVIVYTGSLIPAELLAYAKADAVLCNSAERVLEEIVEVMVNAVKSGKRVVRLHSGDPCIYGTLSEQMQELDRCGIEYEVVPGVSSAFAAAAALKAELTLPEISQTVIFTRIEGKTMMPERESLALLAARHCTLVIFLSTQYIERVVNELSKEYPVATPVAVVQKASWPDQKVVRGTLGDIVQKVRDAKIVWTAVILVGEVLRTDVERPKSRLYDEQFAHGYREKKD